MWEFEISNVAGIRNGSTTLQSGANAVQASNWQGKTSLITAIKTVLAGSTTSSTLTNGADSGYVHLKTSDKDYECQLQRTGEAVKLDGKTYLDEEQNQIAAELYAFLGESNSVRTAVREGNDLTPHLIEPLRREDIEGQMKELKSERETVKTELERAKGAAEELPSKIKQISRIEDELSNLKTELNDVEGDASDTGEQEKLRNELKQARRKQEQVSQRINRLEKKISSLKSQIEQKEKKLDSLIVPSESNLSDKLSNNRSKLREVNQEIETLEALYNATKTVLEGDHLDLLVDIDRQIDHDYLSCWVCGSDTTRDTIETRMGKISEMISERRDHYSELQTTVSDLEEKQSDIAQKRRQKTSLKESLDKLRADLADAQDEIITAEEELEDHTANVNKIESRVEETDDHRKSLEKEIAQKETKIERLRDKKETLQNRAEKCDNLEKEIDELSDQIEALRSRRQDVIQTARTAFDEALEDVVDKFNPSFEKARLKKHVDESGRTTRLELVIVRNGQEISVNALSEGEVELIGFITALAGYEAFDVADQVPCILVDDLGGLASEHIRTLMRYLENRTDYLVTTAYPEAGELKANIISPGNWDVLSDDMEQTA